MITTKTPLRVSLAGSITDIPDYYLRHGGSNISATIDKYVDVSVERLDTPDLAPPHCHAGVINALTELGCRYVPFTFVERGSYIEN